MSVHLLERQKNCILRSLFSSEIQFFLLGEGLGSPFLPFGEGEVGPPGVLLGVSPETPNIFGGSSKVSMHLFQES